MLTTKSADARVIDMTAESSISDLEERIESLTTANKDGIARVHELEEISEEYTTNLTNLREELHQLQIQFRDLNLNCSQKHTSVTATRLKATDFCLTARNI